ncbi:MAG TPA: protein kinase [Micromonosporaceae bacterium]|nr:protein kinase [Micromonosporaceae bacterium]
MDPQTVGPYRLLGRLGSGGMGHVYLGQSLAGKLVAVKVIRSELADDPAFLRRFEREVAVARKISALHTAPVVDADPHANPPWFATAYIEGPSLATLVRQLGPMSLQAVFTLAAGVAEALAELHRVGLVHRDLKPANILLTEAGAHVIDFGIALPVESTRLTSSVILGTPGFIAPERIEGHEGSPASDIFSLGACLVYAATGHAIVRESNVAAQLAQLTRGRFDLVGLPPSLRPLVLRCLARDPKDRPTAEELVRTLVAAGVARPRPGWFGPAWPVDLGTGGISRLGRPWSRRRVLTYGGFVAAGLAAGAAAAAATGWPSWVSSLFGRGPSGMDSVRLGYGRVVWQAMVEHDAASPPIVANDEVIIVERLDDDGNPAVVGVNRLSPSKSWTYPRHSLSGAWGDLVVLRGPAGLLVTDVSGVPRFEVDGAESTLVVPLTPQRLAVTDRAATTRFFDQDGTMVWEYAVDTPEEPAVLVAHGSGDLWVAAVAPGAAAESEIRAVDVAGREELWRHPLQGRPRAVLVTGNWVLLALDDEPPRCLLLSAADGAIVHIADGDWEPVTATPGQVILRRRLGARHWLAGRSQVDGRELWEHEVNSAAVVAVSPDGATLYEIAYRQLRAHDPRTGDQLWSVPLPEQFRDSIAASITVAGDVAYVFLRPSGLEVQPLTANVVALALAEATTLPVATP